MKSGREKVLNTETCYISGPVTGYADGNKPAFDRVKNSLELKGYAAISPFDGESPKDTEETLKDEYGSTYWKMLGKDLMLMSKADSLVLLTGWPSSRGAKIEALAALMAEKKFYECHYSPKGEFFLKKISGNDIAYSIYRNSING